MSKKEVAKIEEYAIMVPDTNIGDIIRENLGGEQISAFDLDRIIVPAGGVTTWTVPTLEGEEEMKALSGIIVHTKNPRVYWQEDFGGGGTPPDCVSEDGIEGLGDPGGKCAQCALSQFGTGKSGRSQACHQRRLLFLVQPDSLLPLVIDVPPSSLKPSKKYLLRLASQRKPAYSVVTTLTLVKAQNQDGIAYGQIAFAAAEEVPNLDVVRAYAQQLKPHLDRAAREMATQEPPSEDDIEFSDKDEEAA